MAEADKTPTKSNGDDGQSDAKVASKGKSFIVKNRCGHPVLVPLGKTELRFKIGEEKEVSAEIRNSDRFKSQEFNFIIREKK